jgi:hypothetical protein
MYCTGKENVADMWIASTGRNAVQSQREKKKGAAGGTYVSFDKEDERDAGEKVVSSRLHIERVVWRRVLGGHDRREIPGMKN